MYTNDWLEYKEFLSHHGVVGQKWGDRHGPPYPLDPNKSVQAKKATRYERRAGKALKKAQKYRKRAAWNNSRKAAGFEAASIHSTPQAIKTLGEEKARYYQKNFEDDARRAEKKAERQIAKSRLYELKSQELSAKAAKLRSEIEMGIRELTAMELTEIKILSKDFQKISGDPEVRKLVGMELKEDMDEAIRAAVKGSSQEFVKLDPGREELEKAVNKSIANIRSPHFTESERKAAIKEIWEESGAGPDTKEELESWRDDQIASFLYAYTMDSDAYAIESERNGGMSTMLDHEENDRRRNQYK